MASFEPIKLGIIGCGAVIQSYYSPALQKLQSEQAYAVKALCDTNATSLKSVHRLFPDAVCHTDSAPLEESDLDLVLIATPPVMHAEHAVRMMRTGKSVLCEKPLAVNAQLAELMLAEARENKVTLAIGMIRRFIPYVSEMQELLQQGRLGNILSWSVTEGRTFDWPSTSDAIFRKDLAGGGILLDIGVHVLDLIQFWFGQASAMTYEDDAADGVEANCRLTMNFESEAKGQIRLSRDTDLPNEIVVTGSAGTVRVLDNVIVQAPAAMKDINARSNNKISASDLFAAQLINVAEAMHGSKELLASPTDCLKTLTTIDSCYKIRKLMPQPWLTADELGALEALR